MRPLSYLSLTGLLFIALISCYGPQYEPVAGDILFQDLESDQTVAIKLATGSEWTHCGIVFEHQGEFFVYEAVGPVIATPIDEWIAQGVDHHFVAKRMGDPGQFLTKGNLEEMKRVVSRHLGKEYDFVFNWSDRKFYCSELVWKTYHVGYGLKLCELSQLREYDLSNDVVKEMMAERYGDDIPLDEPVVAPSDIFASEHLYTVFER